MEGGSGGVHLCSDELRSASDKSKVIMKSGVMRDPVSAAFFFFVSSCAARCRLPLLVLFLALWLCARFFVVENGLFY